MKFALVVLSLIAAVNCQGGSYRFVNAFYNPTEQQKNRLYISTNSDVTFELGFGQATNYKSTTSSSIQITGVDASTNDGADGKRVVLSSPLSNQIDPFTTIALYNDTSASNQFVNVRVPENTTASMNSAAGSATNAWVRIVSFTYDNSLFYNIGVGSKSSAYQTVFNYAGNLANTQFVQVPASTTSLLFSRDGVSGNQNFTAVLSPSNVYTIFLFPLQAGNNFPSVYITRDRVIGNYPVGVDPNTGMSDSTTGVSGSTTAAAATTSKTTTGQQASEESSSSVALVASAILALLALLF